MLEIYFFCLLTGPCYIAEVASVKAFLIYSVTRTLTRLRLDYH